MTETTITTEIPKEHFNVAYVKCEPEKVEEVLKSKCADFYYIYSEITNKLDLDLKPYYVCLVKEVNGRRLIAYQDKHDGMFAYKNLKPMPTMVVPIEVIIALNEDRTLVLADPIVYLTARDFIQQPLA